MDLSKVDSLVVEEHIEQIEDVMPTDGMCFNSAKQNKLNNGKNNGVYAEMKNDGQKCIPPDEFVV